MSPEIVLTAAIACFFLQTVQGLDPCSGIDNCDECFRKDCRWCTKENMPRSQRCTGRTAETEDWCIGERYEALDLNITEGNIIKKTVRIGSYVQIPVSYVPGANVKVKLQFAREEQRQFISMKPFNTSCEKRQCQVELTALSCSGGQDDVVKVTLVVGSEELVLELVVPCSCPCSTNIISSSSCVHGNILCEVCVCDKGWLGEKCDQMDVVCKDRGDLENDECVIDGVTCSNKGHCKCGKCICHTNEYFLTPENFCAGICSVTSEYVQCRNSPRGSDKTCGYDIDYQMELNFTALENQRIDYDLNWVTCEVKTKDNCDISYRATKDGIRTKVIVDLKNCTQAVSAGIVATPGMSATVYVPVVLICLLAAVVAAVAGYMFWNAQKKPDVLSDLQYENIDAENCKGENPLYKPPTTSFKNPIYEKV